MRSGLGPRLLSHPRGVVAGSAVLLALAITVVLAASAGAATYTVGTPEDTPRGELCPEPTSGTCSLRQLVEYENALPETPKTPDVIAVPSGKYELLYGTLTITQSLLIKGVGARTTTVDISPDGYQERVFDLQGPTESAIVIVGLEIAGGTAEADEGYGEFGGDIRNTTGDLLLNEDWITEGTATDGGGISNDGGTLEIEHSLVSGNHATGDAGDSGGIQDYGTAKHEAGFLAPGKKAILAVEDSTVAENEAADGGGIFSWSEDGVKDENGVSVINSTVAYNRTAEACPEGCEPSKGAGLLATDGTIDVVGSIVAYNSGTVDEEYTLSNCSFENATIDSLGYNLENGTECGFKSTGDLQNTFPDFSSGETLQNNGGNTDTLAPEPTSPGVDAIPASAPFCSGTDQRGIARPQGTGCDIGAVELVPFTIETTEGSQFSGPVTASLAGGIYPSPAPTIEWGDGTASAGTVDEANSTVSGTHTYARAGTYDGSVTYYNDNGPGVHTIAFQAKVADAALSATAVPVSAAAGAQFTGTVATFTDANPESVASDFTATIDWGDGASTTAGTVGSAAGGFTVTGSHTYAKGGTYVTSITIKDIGGATATATSTATVTGTAGPAPSPAPPTLAATSPPVVITTTSAAFTATVNPDGLETEVHFEYGPVLGGANAASAGTITYGSVTPDQSVGSDFADHTITTTVTGLLPNVTYNVRAVATNSAGSATGTNQTLVTPADPPPPPPVLGKSVNVTPVSGVVYVELPPGATLASAASVSPFSPFALGVQAVEALTKGQTFIPLTEARQIPVGSVLETTGGVVGITTATTASQKGKQQTGDFGGGIFKLLQNRKQRGLTDLDIVDNHSASQVCATVGKRGKALAAKLSSKTLGRVNASGHGHFAVRGQYSAATVRGTVWNVANRCEGTLTHVVRGVVSVRDFRRRKTITLFTGESYLARGPVKRG
jgi:hypothetical protein